jgi:hypothetical protein
MLNVVSFPHVLNLFIFSFIDCELIILECNVKDNIHERKEILAFET